MHTPYFSIVVPTYNRAHLIGKTIQSVLGQSFNDWELLIIDDGSTDSTRDVIKQFNDARLKYYWQQNAERSAARNKGITLAQGQFICFLDSDDHWRSNHLQVLFNAIQNAANTVALFFTGMAWNFADRKQDVVYEPPAGKNAVEYVVFNQLAPSTTCIHQSILQKHVFNNGLRINEDVELFARIAGEYEIVQVPEVTVDFIIHSENTRALEKDMITPQIKAMEIIFSNPALAGKISEGFKKQRIRNLRHQLINYYDRSKQFTKMNTEIIRFLLSYPCDYQNKSKIVLLLYNLPGGRLLQKLIGKLKS